MYPHCFSVVVEVLQLDVGGLQLLCHSRVIGTGEAKAGEEIDRGQLFPDEVAVVVVTMRVKV
jgi:hypothetical protein